MKIPSQLINEIQTGNCALFVGAGLSIIAGLPSWNELRVKLATELRISTETDNVQVAQYYENQYGRHRLLETINEQINKSVQPTISHRAIAKLPFPIIFTTNYDTLIEQAFHSERRKYSVIVSDEAAAYWSSDVVQIVKIHGSITEPKSLVVTSDDYMEFFRRHPVISNILKLQSSTKTLLFIGYSFRDIDFNLMLNEIKHEIGEHIRQFYWIAHPNTDEHAINDLERKNIVVIKSLPQEFFEKLLKSVKIEEAPTPKDILSSFEKQYEVDERLCFILMPFREDLDEIYQEVIKPVVEEKDLKCIRADEIYGTDSIMDDIWKYIQKAKLVIAELTSRNPNVFYELGLAHAMRKKTILITQTLDDVPFDLRHRRCIVYSNTIRGAFKLNEHLEKTITSVLQK